MTASMIKYLLAIKKLNEKNQITKAVDVVKEVGVSAPSVCKALSMLKEKRLIEYGNNFSIKLSSQGVEGLNKCLVCKEYIEKELVAKLTLDKKNAELNAIAITGAISTKCMDQILKLIYNNNEEAMKCQ